MDTRNKIGNWWNSVNKAVGRLQHLTQPGKVYSLLAFMPVMKYKSRYYITIGQYEFTHATLTQSYPIHKQFVVTLFI